MCAPRRFARWFAWLMIAGWPLAASSADPAQPVGKIALAAGETLVFLGDSITHQCLYTQYVEDFFYTRQPGVRAKFHNAGVGGARAWDALQRFERDVAAYHPKYVTVLLGMNDGTYQPYNDEVFQTYRTDMSQVIERIKAARAIPVLMTPTMFDSRAARLGGRTQQPERLELYNSVLAYYGAWLREIAVENGYGFVDMYGPLNNLTLEQRRVNPSFTMIKDAVHPDAPGQIVMAAALLEHMGQRGPLSNITVQPDAKGQFAVRATGGEAADLTVEGDRIRFTWTAKGLPFALPEEARPGAKLLALGHRMSREGLEVHGMKPGRYRLTIDGEPVGEFASAALERHIELQENEKTPQFRQALRVAELNKQRNSGPVHALRGEWLQFQQYARLKRQLEAKPDDAKVAEDLAKLKERIDTIEDRIREHEAAAAKIEDEIFQTNQPKPRTYVLERIES
ncbi:MAG: SGNH/GDSL hydrolase family protein [Planctomycetes bacterium]|nr:SGNH/GDSL hydrolase family protein [Planctomycetota bacterium]